MSIKIAIVDDHPVQIDGYKTVLQHASKNVEFTSVYSCEAAYNLIIDVNKNFYDFLILDRSLPAYKEKNINSGEDLALLAKKYWPGVKIVMITSHSEAFILYDILHQIEPFGLLVKSDFSAEELLSAFETMLRGKKYFSETVIQAKKKLTSKKAFLDSHNRQIIRLLAQGVKTKNLPEHLNLSQSAVEKRKAIIKDYLDIDHGGDQEIIFISRKLGLI